MKKLLIILALAVGLGITAGTLANTESNTSVTTEWPDFPTVCEHYCAGCNMPLNSPKPLYINNVWVNGKVGCPMCKTELTWQEVMFERTTKLVWTDEGFVMMYVEKYLWMAAFGSGGAEPISKRIREKV